MPEPLTPSRLEWEALQSRLKKLAEEKAHLQMMNGLMTKLQTVTGLQNTLDTMLRAVLESVGGTHICIYYFIGNIIHYADVFGEQSTLGAISDPQILEVMQSRRFTTWEDSFTETRMQTNAFATAKTYVFPLLVGNDLIGVFKMEGMMLQPSDFRSYLSTFFHYAALALQHEIISFSSLQKAYRDLKTAHSQLNQDIMLAAKVQKALLPESFSESFLSVESIYHPYRSVSGDFYDFTWSKDNQRFSGFILDVSGHGIASSLQGLVISAFFRQTMDSPMGLAARLCWINQQASRYFTEETFAAAVCFEFDFAKRTLAFACAGIYKFLASCAALPTVVITPGSLIGIVDNPEFSECIVPFSPGDTFYFMSDGIFDQMNAADLLPVIDFERTLQQLRALAEQPNRHDDCSALCIRIEGKVAFPLVFDYFRPADRTRIQSRIRQLLLNIAAETAGRIDVAIGEALANATRQSMHVRVKINRLGSWLVVRIRDNGTGFDGNGVISKLWRQQSAEIFDERLMAEGGRGLPIMVAWMDRVLYNRTGTEVLLVKKLAQQ
jgi:serine phosphatase RsbU (regulator of sigma subunit)/anti-sigma regulatory factor (Ser/Thr protein kinase)